MVALITGASGGIGGMCAYRAVRKGYKVAMVCHRGEASCQALAGDLRDLGGEVAVFCADITKKDDRERLVQQVTNLFGAPDVLINAAGIARRGVFLELADAATVVILDCDLTAQMLLSRLVLPGMIAKGGGSIVNVSSVWGMVGASCEVAYSAAKAGLIGFTKALAKEVAPAGVRVNAVAPGVTDTAMMHGYTDEEIREIKAAIPLGRMASALEIADGVWFLAESEFTTGQVLSSNGGSVI